MMVSQGSISSAYQSDICGEGGCARAYCLFWSAAGACHSWYGGQKEAHSFRSRSSAFVGDMMWLCIQLAIASKVLFTSSQWYGSKGVHERLDQDWQGMAKTPLIKCSRRLGEDCLSIVIMLRENYLLLPLSAGGWTLSSSACNRVRTKMWLDRSFRLF